MRLNFFIVYDLLLGNKLCQNVLYHIVFVNQKFRSVLVQHFLLKCLRRLQPSLRNERSASKMARSYSWYRRMKTDTSKVPMFIPRICAYVTLPGKKDFGSVITLRILRWGNDRGLPTWAQCNHRGPHMGEAGGLG